MQRVAVVGNTGSGKTSLAERLVQKLGCAHVELDALAWGAGWELLPVEVFRPRLEAALQGEAWVVDGNYRKVRDLVWGRADTLIWLDYSLAVIYPRLLRRTLKRLLTREELWAGNRETLRGAFFSRDSLFRYAIQKQKQHRQDYPLLLAQPEYAHLHVLRFRSPGETRRWLDGNFPGDTISK